MIGLGGDTILKIELLTDFLNHFTGWFKKSPDKNITMTISKLTWMEEALQFR